MKPLYGHTSQATAYMIDDYPYGSKLRCRRRVWLEYKASHGFRFMSQTEHPTRKVWNKPHASTYIETAAGLYLDEQGHVGWTGVGIYTDPVQALEFARIFGSRCDGAKQLLGWAKLKADFGHKLATGQAYFSTNRIKQERSETERLADQQDADRWTEVVRLMTVTGI